MNDLLIGCKILLTPSDGEVEEGIIVGRGAGAMGDMNILWVLCPNGQIEGWKILSDVVKIHPDDVKFIQTLNKDYKLRKKILESSSNRFELLDIREEE
jgi:hypothetical protein